MSHDLFSEYFMLDIILKSLLLMSITAAGAFLLRYRSAATIHRWWVLGFCGCLIIPVVALISPTWNLPILPTLPLAEEPRFSVPPPRIEKQALPTAGSLVARVPVQQVTPVSKEKSHTPAKIRQPTSENLSPTSGSPRFSWTLLLGAFWFAGTLACLLRTTWQQVSLMRLLRRCTKVYEQSWKIALQEAASSLGLRRQVTLLKLLEAQSPLTAGLVRHTVILPRDADQWCPQRRRFVLLHELAHVKRHDVLAQLIAGLVCALYWFNPLCWVGLFQMRKLRELACDDLVIACGQPQTDYADVLLDVARSYRHRTLSTVVGMAHSSNVENRIMAILDKARSHVSLSRKAARVLLVAATALVLVIGSMRLESQAEPVSNLLAQEAGNDKTAESKVQNDLLREMRIRILDDGGKPLEGAMLTVGIWYPEGYEGPRTEKIHTADADGTVVLQIPKRLHILRLWPKQSGYVGEFKNFSEGSHRDGELIPDEIEFRLAKGHNLGGRIVDSEDNPIEGVHVRVQVEDSSESISTWLTDSFGQPTVKTNEEGRWKLNSAPAHPDGGTDYSFYLKLSHDDYISDVNWGDVQKAQGVGAAELRSGEATIILQRGKSVSGIVTDHEGNPVEKGWVVWSDEPYFYDGVYEKEVNADGTFRTPPLSAGKHPITIVAPGFAAQRRMVEVGNDSKQLRFELRPGKRIEIRFVDTSGNPVSKVGVYLANSSNPDTWNGSNALHNHKHPNVPDYGVPRRADENGVYVWDWAPEEPVKYSVGAKGFAPQEISLVAKSDPHIITLADARVVVGTVKDATTGEEIEKFQAMPVIVFRPNFFSTRYLDTKQGANGRYELPLTGSGDLEDRYRVRFEADGYRSIVSDQSYGPLDGRAIHNVQLEPAAAREGRVVDATGAPIEDAMVIEGTPTWVPSTSNGEPDAYGERIVRTDSGGRFVLNATAELVRVRVLHDLGVFEKLFDPEEDSIGDMQLQPWASISGRLLQDGKPVAGQSIYFSPMPSGQLGEPRFQDSYYAQSDDQGRFQFDRLPPIQGSLRASLGPWQDSPLTSSPSMPLELKPGEQRTVNLGGEGTTITGQVVETGREDTKLSKQWSLNYLISRDRGIDIPAQFASWSFDPSDGVQPSWLRNPGFHDWLGTRENYFVKLSPEGDMQINGVPPGTYDLVLQLYEQPAGCLVETIGSKVVAVEVTESDQATGTKDLGKIEVPCRAGPRVGESMQVYKFLDPSGQERTIFDMKGRYVLMHVWASWCASCLEHMPEMKATLDDLSEQPVTFVGLNIDKDRDQAKQLAERNGWNWSQNYLGDDSDMARQLAISSVPTYFLIGPDGLLVASSIEWSEIKEKLRSALEQE
ncbi:M56 family metallopeptidase [Bythopirellula goksoeyrii]|uniref:Regulatory protein BlaR1 n=1 Tax=Bythopirellula goksoeyrii TaxID=1400387 RepID=A0A5B9QIV6_9BACT|nr:M56 family metallopeptidase [Bythopirellula goksoeyrii]QEG36966.1 Regulatory protein BlaR1 [Bythopirellula goksoeyrii]